MTVTIRRKRPDRSTEGKNNTEQRERCARDRTEGLTLPAQLPERRQNSLQGTDDSRQPTAKEPPRPRAPVATPPSARYWGERPRADGARRAAAVEQKMVEACRGRGASTPVNCKENCYGVHTQQNCPSGWNRGKITTLPGHPHGSVSRASDLLSAPVMISRSGD